ncbi:MAG TPA: FAD-dependent oxidoreductase [Solirubrobacterales bacterium]|nr:FAD-dependent oxidoreductase [Solirubrobacterales bacterium]
MASSHEEPGSGIIRERERAGFMSRQVVILGGGVAGLEALMALHDLAGDRAEVTLVAPDPDFIYKPLLVEEPFDVGPAEQHALAPLAEELGARFVQRAAKRVEPAAHTVELDDGSKLDYDFLIACAGGRFRRALEGATTFPSGEPLRINELLEAGEGPRRIAFVVPSGVTWALPIYEIALMTQRRAVELRLDEVKLTIVTPEQAPLAIFGPAASDAVAQLLAARGIQVEAGVHAHEGERGELILTPGDRHLEAAEVVALPAMEGPAIAGLPKDEGGFIPIDEHARVRGVEDVYAAGDGTNFPIKQGGLGTQQADAAASHIAHLLGAATTVEPFHPVLRGKLLTGEESLHLRADVAGGGGVEEASLDCLWWPPHKISGRYLAPFLYHGDVHAEPEPPRHPLEVEVALPREWHEKPMGLDPYSSPRID